MAVWDTVRRCLRLGGRQLDLRLGDQALGMRLTLCNLYYEGAEDIPPGFLVDVSFCGVLLAI